MSLGLSRIDRLYRTYDVAATLPGGGSPTLTGVDVALLPPGSGPTSSTVWIPAAYADGVATVLFAGPDADPTGAVVVAGAADLWIRIVDTPEIDAIKVERITVLNGGPPLAPPPVRPVESVNGQTGAVVIDLAAKQDVATLAADTATHVTDGSALDVALRAAFGSRTPPALGMLTAALAVRNTAPVVIVGAGSSTTFGTGASTAAKRYLNRLASAVQAAYPLDSGALQTETITLTQAVASPPTSPGIQFVNAGIGGTNSGTYLTATTGPQVAALNPAAILHMPTTNDFRIDKAPASTRTDLLARLDQLDADATKPILHVLIRPFQVSDALVTDGTAYTWDDYGQVMRDIAAERPDNVIYIDLDPFYRAAGVPGPDPNGLMTADLVHQNDAGHAMMADLIRDALHLPAVAGGSGGSTPPAVVTVLASDNFNRADGALGAATTGQTWTTTAGTTAIVSNKAKATVSGTGMAFVDVGTPNQDVRATVTLIDGQTSTGGLVFRSLDASNRCGAFLAKSTGALSIIRTVGGTGTTLATSAPVSITGGDHTLRVIAKGQALTVYWDGVSVLTYTLTQTDNDAMTTWTKAGFRSPVAEPLWDDFVVQSVA